MLEQLRLSRGYLFSNGDQLDFANLIRPHAPGRARLVVISLAFIPDLGDQQFFVSRLLAEARRFCRASPSKSLQVLLVLDEADVFMPATSKPATKRGKDQGCNVLANRKPLLPTRTSEEYPKRPSGGPAERCPRNQSSMPTVPGATPNISGSAVISLSR
jgi:hypothetical protein